MDIPVLEQLIRDVAAHLEPSGHFIFTLPHPSFFNQKLGRDPDTGQPFRAVAGYHKEEVWRLGSFGGHNHYHRSLTFYTESLRRNGFAVTRLVEPEHIPNDTSDLADFGRSIPVFMLLEARPLGH